MAQSTGRIVSGDESDVHDEPHLAGRRITVRQVVERVETGGESPENVADEYDLSLADVYRALAYYYDHPAKMAAVDRRRRERERATRDSGAETIDEIRERTE